MWAQLPELILTQVFSKLAPADRASCIDICQHWTRCLGSPSLWRRCSVQIDRDLATEQSVISELVEKYGEHMRVLELSWTRPYPCSATREPRIARSVRAEAGADFLALVREKEVQLRELILTNWTFSSKWGNCGKLLCALANLLAGQQDLQSLSLTNANLNVADILRLLAIVTKVCGDKLSSLNLSGAFREWQAPFANARFLRFLGRMHALTHLSLDYSALSDGTLNALTVGAAGVLQNFHVLVRDSDSRNHRVEDVAWNKLVNACPALRVSYTIVNISHHEDVRYLLLPSVPLAKFQMFSQSHVWDQSRTRNFRGTVAMLIAHYTDTLAEVLLQYKNNREMLDDLLISLVTRCKRLQRVQFDGIMRSFETVTDICHLQATDKTRFQSIHVRPRSVNLMNRRLLQSIEHEYAEKMKKKGVDFLIDRSA